MARRTGALLAAAAAAPYLFLLFASLTNVLAGGPLGIDDLRDLAGLLVVGGVGLALFGVPILLISGLAALLFERLGWHTRVHAMAGGAVLGSGLASLFLLQALSPSWTYPVSGAMAGAVCGWIYRSIASGGRRGAAVL